jgi:ABC-type uncharacterized transport system permease subunit
LYTLAFTAQLRYLQEPSRNLRITSLLFTLIAALLQMWQLHLWIDTTAGQNLDVFNLINFITWLWVMLTLISCLRTRMENTLLLIIPINLLTIAGVLLYAGQTVLPLAEHPTELWHIVLALLAYATFGVAALQALVLAMQLQCLSKNPGQKWLDAMPPLEAMQSLMFRTLLLGFSVLTVAIGLGLRIEEHAGQLYLSKSGLSILAWAIYLALLIAHYKYGVKLRIGVLWTILAWLGLSFAYFGTRIL